MITVATVIERNKKSSLARDAELLTTFNLIGLLST